MKAFLMNSIRSKLRFFGNLKIQSKLLLSFVSVFVISIIIVIFIFYNNWSLSVRAQAVEFSMPYIKQLNENLNSYVNELDRLTAMTFADSRVQNILEMKVRDLSDAELKKM